jgi:AcrR family transcriptional regulator
MIGVTDMEKDVKGSRRYDSSWRKEQARITRRAVLHAAHDLFVNQGYGHTTMVEVAQAAGVSVETVYGAFRNKATLLHRVWDVTIGGDDEEIAYHERPEVQALLAEPDLARRFAAQATLFTATARRIVPLVLAIQGAAASESAAADMLAEIGRQRLHGMSVMARAAAATGHLAVSEDECRDLLWATTDGILWQRLVSDLGWSDDQFEAWLGTMWTRMLVAPSREGRDDAGLVGPRAGQRRGDLIGDSPEPGQETA